MDINVLLFDYDMCRYKNLIDTVTKIVKINGIEILSESRFWGMLTDLYPFTHESKLREIYKTCISKGWISTIVYLSDNKRNAIDFINQTIPAGRENEREEISACLFSVVIAIGICNLKDYECFIKDEPETYSLTSSEPSQPTRLQPERKGRRSKMIRWIFLVVVTFCIPLVIITHKKYKSDKSQSKELSEYEKKVKENEDLVKNREDYDSTLAFKNIMLGSDYKIAIQEAKSNKDFKEGKERYYKIEDVDRFHPILQLMNGKFKVFDIPDVVKSDGNDIIKGKVFITHTNLDTIAITLNIFEWNGKVSLILLDGEKDSRSDWRSFCELISIYFEKYHLPESRTFDGMPYNPEKDYSLPFYMVKPDEEKVWTFSSGVIRFGYHRILYASSEFLNNADTQFEEANKIYNEKKKNREDSIRKAEEIKHRDDSLRRIKNHENTIKEI